MKILFDQGTPVPLRKHLQQYEVDTTAERGWSTVTNGDLLKLAEANHFDLFITTDQNLRYQQKLSNRNIAILVIMGTSWPKMQQCIPAIQSAIATITLGDYREVSLT